jgi:hypothetical protein
MTELLVDPDLRPVAISLISALDKAARLLQRAEANPLERAELAHLAELWIQLGKATTG